MTFNRKQKFSLRKLKFGLGSVLLGTTLSIATPILADTEAQPNTSTEVKAINHEYESLTKEQQGQILKGLPELKNLDCGDTVHFVFKKDGKVVVTDKPAEPTKEIEKTVTTQVKEPTKEVKEVAEKSTKQLPKTGSKQFVAASLIGFVMVGTSAYLLYKHKKTAKLMIIALTLAGAGLSSVAKADSQQMFNNVYKISKSTTENPKLDGYEYVGYWIEDGDCEIPGVTKVPNNYPTTEKPEAVIVEKEVIKEVPTVKEVIVEKEVPVEKIVEKEVIKEVVKEVIKEIPTEVEKIVEKEVVKEVPVEKIVEKEVVKEVPVEKIVEKEVVKEVPVEKIVEKEVIKEVPVEKIVEKEKVVEVEKVVENNTGLERIEVNTPIPFTIRVVEVDDLKPGEHRIRQEGETGMHHIIKERRFVNGVQEGDEKTIEESTKDPVEMIIEIGKDVKLPVPNKPDGSSIITSNDSRGSLIVKFIVDETNEVLSKTTELDNAPVETPFDKSDLEKEFFDINGKTYVYVRREGSPLTGKIEAGMKEIIIVVKELKAPTIPEIPIVHPDYEHEIESDQEDDSDVSA